MPKYLLIFEDFSIQATTNYDIQWLDSIEAGLLTVIKFANGEYLDLEASGEWSVIGGDHAV